jgi:hypothetical protein
MKTFKRGLVEYGSQQAFDLLNAHSLTDLESVFQHGETIHKRYGAKSVSFATLDNNEKTSRIYIKKQWKPARLIPRMHTIRAGRVLWSYPYREWRGILRFLDIGLDPAEPLAFFRHRWNPFRAAVITRAVPPEMNLNEMITNGKLEKLDSGALTSLGEAVVSVIERIHNAGLSWRSMDIKHFYPAQQDDGSWRIWLIDCEGVQSFVKQRYIKRERQSVVNRLRINLGQDKSVIKNFLEPIEQQLLTNL